PMVLAFTVLALMTLLVLVPSLREEIKPTINVDARGRRREAILWSERLGAWLGAGLAALQRTFTTVVPPRAVVGGPPYRASVYQQVAYVAASPGPAARWIAEWQDYLQGETLVAAGKWLAGGALTVAALGARFRQTFGRLRVALDAVLDIDNYFADPPNRQPPRRASTPASRRCSSTCATAATPASSSWRTARAPSSAPTSCGTCTS